MFMLFFIVAASDVCSPDFFPLCSSASRPYFLSLSPPSLLFVYSVCDGRHSPTPRKESRLFIEGSCAASGSVPTELHAQSTRDTMLFHVPSVTFRMHRRMAGGMFLGLFVFLSGGFTSFWPWVNKPVFAFCSSLFAIVYLLHPSL